MTMDSEHTHNVIYIYLHFVIIATVSCSVPSRLLLRMTAVRKDLNELRDALNREPREPRAFEGRGAERNQNGTTERD